VGFGCCCEDREDSAGLGGVLVRADGEGLAGWSYHKSWGGCGMVCWVLCSLWWVRWVDDDCFFGGFVGHEVCVIVGRANPWSGRKVSLLRLLMCNRLYSSDRNRTHGDALDMHGTDGSGRGRGALSSEYSACEAEERARGQSRYEHEGHKQQMQD
jgi:hypothetical protein